MRHACRIGSPRAGGARLLGTLGFGLVVAGCTSGVIGGGGGPGEDLAGGGGGGDLAMPMENLCGDFDPTCAGHGFGPPQAPFPLSGDPNADPNGSDTGVVRDPDGFLGLGASGGDFDFVYTANSEDWGRGTVSKIYTRTVKEVARYYSVTCWSNAAGGLGGCDGTNGCCTRDDYARFQRRKNGQMAGAHEPVQLTSNNPSRTAVDFNGDVWVANRAFGGQGSVTKIANDLTECTDRNGTPGLQTSRDVNGDGLIDTDCNRNGVPDSVADVQAAGCVNGMAQEFYGHDDECILFTVNTNVNNSIGRPLALGRGAVDFAPADAWPGSFNDGKFVRVDGSTGLIKAEATVPGNPYGAAIDSQGILWATAVAGGGLYYFDTGNPGRAAATRNPAGFGLGGYGIGMDRDQNVWMGGYPGPHAYRYTPDRGGGMARLGQGYWTMVQNVGAGTGAGGCQGRGIAADSRTPNLYFVWMVCHGAPFMVRIDASQIPVPAGVDKSVDGSMMASIRVAGGYIAGAGIDIEQNIWAIATTGPGEATRIKVDNQGNITPPTLNGTPGQGCPVGNGDWCSLGLNGVDPNPSPYTYSDFSGFGLRNFTNPKGTYSYVFKGCPQGDTRWMRVTWDATVPANTSLAVRARSGPSPTPGAGWGGFTGSFVTSPAEVSNQLMPNPADYLQVEFDFSTMDRTSSPKLKSFNVYYECSNIPG